LLDADATTEGSIDAAMAEIMEEVEVELQAAADHSMQLMKVNEKVSRCLFGSVSTFLSIHVQFREL